LSFWLFVETLYIDLPAFGGHTGRPVFFYGHFDKQPETQGWSEGLGPWRMKFFIASSVSPFQAFLMNSAVVVMYVISLERKAPEGAFLLKTGKGIQDGMLWRVIMDQGMTYESAASAARIIGSQLGVQAFSIQK